MPQPFRFKQFSVNDDRCAQKVGTDSIVLGSWALANSVATILDIGTGCGLLALMLAQRFPKAQITAVEIDRPAYEQAADNFHHSPWAGRLSAVQTDIKDFRPDGVFDLIVCNPPYFQGGIASMTEVRKIARQDKQLTLVSLSESAARLLSPVGSFNVILPIDRTSELITAAKNNDLHPVRHCDVRPTSDTAAKRSLLEFQFQAAASVAYDKITLEQSRHEYHSDYVSLAREFLLRM
ncbi:UNVERIFIED_CONTAM: hypothetical protein GTU68_050456 [Idotea baltica]|nr:hypothetical protein [Idotea baltica]